MIAKDNLNNWTINTAFGEDLPGSYYRPVSATSSDESISVYFRNLEDELLSKINEYPIVVGCIAWLTNEKILKALSAKSRVSIIIQKEDFLRPDVGNWSGKKLRRLYGDLPPGPRNNNAYAEIWGNLLSQLNYGYAWEAEPIRWAGNFNTEKNPAFPRMHNKFLVFCDENSVSTKYEDLHLIEPKSVWTGSFNLTNNATQSLENAIYVKDSKIVEAYFAEWQYIFGLSESIPNEFWEMKWSPSDFRIGT